MKRITLAILACLVAIPAMAQQAPLPVTITLSPDEAQGVIGALSHETQLACMMGQCANANAATITVPRAIYIAEQAAQSAAAAKAAQPAPSDPPK